MSVYVATKFGTFNGRRAPRIVEPREWDAISHAKQQTLLGLGTVRQFDSADTVPDSLRKRLVST